MKSIKQFFDSLQLTNQREKLLQPYEVALAGPPRIFNLTTDCFNEIFDNLSLTDLHSFALTCQSMQKTAGEYFKVNYKSAEKYTTDDCIYTTYPFNLNGIVVRCRVDVSIFNAFINFISHTSTSDRSFRYIQMHIDEFTSLNEIHLKNLSLNEAAVHCLRHLLPKIEILRLVQMSIDGNFYDKFLILCPKLKEIHVQHDFRFSILSPTENPWLLKQFPLLEKCQLISRDVFKINELCTFFETNQGIHTFSTKSDLLWENRDELLKCSAQLNRLEILDGYFNQVTEFPAICSLLNQLYDKGFYKQLHLDVIGSNQFCGEHFASLHALKSININEFDKRCSLTRLKYLKELTLGDCFDEIDMEILAGSLVSLERLGLIEAVISDILPFVKHSVNLNKIELHYFEGPIDLELLNRERKQLEAARKIEIFVREDVFFETKWTAKDGNLNLSLIEVKRMGT